MASRRGRPRKPTALHLLEGTARRDRMPPAEPQPKGEAEPMVRLTGEALKMWREIVPELKALGLATNLDGPTLTMLCHWWAEYRRWQSMSDKRIDPWQRASMMAAATKWVRTIAKDYGLTPTDRASLKVGEQKEETNPFKEFLRQQAT